MRRKIIIQAPTLPPKGLQESIKSLENAANLLRNLRENGVSREVRSQIRIPDIEDHQPPPLLLTEAQYAFVSEMARHAEFSEYETGRILEAIIQILVKTLVAGDRIKLNKLGSLSAQLGPRGHTVQFVPSPTLVQDLAG